jgi:hypothetical protein
MLRVMECALWADTSFLAGLGVMDYSLLVGEWGGGVTQFCFGISASTVT